MSDWGSDWCSSDLGAGAGCGKKVSDSAPQPNSTTAESTMARIMLRESFTPIPLQSRDRVPTRTAPGMAADDTFQRKPKAALRPIARHCLYRIGREHGRASCRERVWQYV